MLILAAYSLQSGTLSSDAVMQRIARFQEIERDWLQSKGATADSDAPSGEFTSQTGGSIGTYSRESVEVGGHHSSELVLTEDARSGLIFSTRVAWLALEDHVEVCVSLSVANDSAVIAPIFTDPRCPRIVRTLLQAYDDWTVGGTLISPGSVTLSVGRAAGLELAQSIRDPARAVPLVVVSQNEGEAIWPDVAPKLSHELAGLANVLEIDDEAAWALTSTLGKRFSCYNGAIRLYWPSRGHKSITGTVWTASALLSADSDGGELSRFVSQLRRRVMATAALTLSAPDSFRQLRSEGARQRLNELEQRNADNAEELEIARMYLADNEKLKKENKELAERVHTLLSRAESAEAALNASKSSDEDSPYLPEDDEIGAPSAGEIRFYKKTHSRPAYDVLVRVADCGHNAWQGAAKADKAKKGIERVEGTNDWKNVQHCGSCTGGGMWKVRW
jgi:hypothetical protein